MSGSRSEVVTLVPAVLAFFVSTPPEGKRGTAGNDAILFTGTLRVNRLKKLRLKDFRMTRTNGGRGKAWPSVGSASGVSISRS